MNKQGSSIWAVSFIVIAGIAGIVALAAIGDKEAAALLPLLIGFLAPTVTSLISAQRAGESNVKLDRIDHRLNGELDGRLEAAIERVLSRRADQVRLGGTRDDNETIMD